MGVDRVACPYGVDIMTKVLPVYAKQERERVARKKKALAKFLQEAKIRAQLNANKWEAKR